MMKLLRNLLCGLAAVSIYLAAQPPALGDGLTTPSLQALQPVATIAALRTMPVPTSMIGGVVYVQEYATGYDTGGGYFRIKSASCTDDNGWKIALQGSHCAWRQGVEAGFKVTDFGAAAYSTSVDSSAAINYAIAAACTSGAPTKQVIFPKSFGVDGSGFSYYLWSTANPINITCSGLTLSGVGGAQIYFTSASLPYCLINSRVGLTTGLTMENLSFEYSQGASGATTCLYLKGIASSIFRNISFPKEINNGFKNPIRVESDDTHLAISNAFYNVGTRTYCDTGSIGINFVASSATLNYGITTERFFGGEINSCLGTGIRSEGGINVFGTIFEESSAKCIELVNPSGAGVTSDNTGNVIVGAYFENCTTYNISYNGNRVYWNTDVGLTIATTPKINDGTGRNIHMSPPYVNAYSERIQIPDGTTTPNVTSGAVFYTSNSSGTVHVTDFLISGGHCQQGNHILLWISDTHTSVDEGTYIHNAGSVNNTTRGWYAYECITGGWRQTSFGAN